METLVYYSRNRKNPPFEVTIVSDNGTVYINCNCPLGIEKKFCRHVINAIRGDKQTGSVLTSDAVITRLRTLFNNRSILRQFMEKEWQKLRIYAYENPNNKEEISEVRKIIGEAFANGFENDFDQDYESPFDPEQWENEREIYADGLNCNIILKYENYSCILTDREVTVKEIFINNAQFYILGYCNLRKDMRTFRVDRIQGITFDHECSLSDKSTLLYVIFKGNYEQREDGSFAGSISQTEPNIWINTEFATDKEKENGRGKDHVYILHKKGE